MLEIKQAKPEHIRDVYELICELEGESMDEDAFKNAYRFNLSNPNICYIVAIQDDEIVGFASLHIQVLLHHGNRIGEIQEIIVKNGTRGCGIGALLFQHLKQKAIDMECFQLEVCCNQHRTLSHQFYEKQNMESTHFKFILKLSS